jgi:pimeloyl-ACP methyl ester carboxylesterase
MAVVQKPRANAWVDREEYPFEPHYLDVDGGRMHYVDEGEGSTVVFVHGNPTWSYLFRGLIRDLSLKHRCIAMDHIGFGLSDKPAQWGYSPELHARNFARLVDHTGANRFTLVTHGMGGPIGLSYAIDHPDKVAGVVVMNSAIWSLKDHGPAKKFDRAVSNPLGKLNYTFSNPAGVVMPKAFVDKYRLTDKLHEQYKGPFRTSKERMGPYGLAKGVLGSSTWMHGLWARREALADKQALILWGDEDRLYTPDLIPRWQSIFPTARVERLTESGHFAIEEYPNQVETEVYLFMDGQREMKAHDAAIMTFD